ncbi:heat-shock protein Hsp20 [Halobacteriales archaeon QS_4_69_34]|nr:MAG: heat-shock protein Hsp20 [Halobacteriales archaeon QS_4_69_34]
MSRRNPFQDIEDLFDRMGRDIDRVSRELGQLPGPAGELASRNARSPAVDVEDAIDEFVVTVDLPGYDREDIDLSVNDRTLRISAGRETTDETGEGSYIRRERRRSMVNRSVSLPEGVEEQNASATYTNGVLTVRLPKEIGEGSGRDIDID